MYDDRELSAAHPEWLRLFDLASTAGVDGLAGYLSRVLEACGRWLRASGASIFLRQGGETFRLAAKYGRQARMPDDAAFGLREGIAGEAAATGQALLIENPRDHPELSRRGVMRRAEIASSMVVPLVVEPQGVIGVLNISRGAGEEPFTKQDLRHVAPLARLIALAVANARHFSETRDNLARQERLRQKLESVLECVPFGLFVVSADQVIEESNSQVSELLGIALEYGRSWPELIEELPAPLRAPLAGAVRAALEGVPTLDRVVDPVSGRAWKVAANPLGAGGATVTLQDITRDEREQQERARTRRLAEIGQMTAAIAHEIRNPLAGIIGAAQIVRDHPEEAPEFGRIIGEEACKLDQLCNDFLDFARPLSLDLQPVTLNALVSSVVNLEAPAAAARGVRLEARLDPSPPTLLADPLRVEQVVRNLVQNAIQATSAGGAVTVTVEGYRLTVSDTGSGMDAEQLSKLFTPFFTTKAKGTGLGLTNVRRILDAHGASIDVRSEPGVGTEFIVDWRSFHES